MVFSTTEFDGEITLRIEGKLDEVTIPGLRPAINSLIAERHRRIIVDLSGVRQLDCSGVGTLVSLCKRSEEYCGAVRLAGARDQPLSMLKSCQLNRLVLS